MFTGDCELSILALQALANASTVAARDGSRCVARLHLWEALASLPEGEAYELLNACGADRAELAKTGGLSGQTPVHIAQDVANGASIRASRPAQFAIECANDLGRISTGTLLRGLLISASSGEAKWLAEIGITEAAAEALAWTPREKT